MRSCMQVIREPQWRSFELATDKPTENGLLHKGVQHCSRKCSSQAKTLQHCHKEHKLKIEIMQLFRRHHAACKSLASDISSYVQVPSFHFLHHLYHLCNSPVLCLNLLLHLRWTTFRRPEQSRNQNDSSPLRFLLSCLRTSSYVAARGSSCWANKASSQLSSHACRD
jgi:hypothetical protein